MFLRPMIENHSLIRDRYHVGIRINIRLLTGCRKDTAINIMGFRPAIAGSKFKLSRLLTPVSYVVRILKQKVTYWMALIHPQ